MHPAFSVIFLTTLIGAGQGLFLALFVGEVLSALGPLPVQDGRFYATGSLLAVALLVAGLVSSLFHLGHPERGWRAAAMWRTSWLSREVIVLPLATIMIAAYGVLHYLGRDSTLIVGALGALGTVALFICTSMIYACIKFLQEWASTLTVINYTLLGTASGFTLAAAYAAYAAPTLVGFYAIFAVVLTIIALASRSASLIRNARIRHKSTLQTAIGVRHTKIVQKAQGFMGGSFNTREFFHGATAWFYRSVKWSFLILTFLIPIAFLVAGVVASEPRLLVAAFAAQYIGLIAERWFFFAEANHPQNLYYQTIS